MEPETNSQKPKKIRSYFKTFAIVILVCVSFFAGTFCDKHLSSKSASSNTIEGLLAKGSSDDEHDQQLFGIRDDEQKISELLEAGTINKISELLTKFR